MAKRPKLDWKSLPKGEITSWKDVENFVKKPAAKKAAAKKAPKIKFMDVKPDKPKISSWKDTSPKPGEAPRAPRASKNPIGDFIRDADKRPKVGEAPRAPRAAKPYANAPKPGEAPRAPRTAKVKAVTTSTGRGIASTALRLGVRVAGPAGALFAMTTATGDGKEAKPSGPLMKGSRKYGGARPEKAGSYPAAKPKAIGARPESPGAYPAKKATPAPKPPAKPAREAPKPTARPSFSKGSSSPPAYTPEKAQKRGNVTSGFQGNWTGAAPSEMQKRGGAKINRGGGLLGKLRKK